MFTTRDGASVLQDFAFRHLQGTPWSFKARLDTATRETQANQWLPSRVQGKWLPYVLNTSLGSKNKCQSVADQISNILIYSHGSHGLIDSSECFIASPRVQVGNFVPISMDG